MKEKLKKNKGITLIALVITIIVLLILAGVTLSTLFGNNGILTESKLAVESNKEANAREQVQLAWAACETEYQAALTKDSTKTRGDYFNNTNLNKNLGAGNLNLTQFEENGKSIVEYVDESNTKYTYEIVNGQVYSDGTAPEVVDPESIAGPLKDKVVAKNYGDFIDYNVDLNGNGNTTDDWKVFYNDGENVFIIASECLPANKIPNISTMTKSGNQVYWNNTVENNTGAKGIDTEVAKKFGLNWLFVENHRNSENSNMKAVQDLMDINKWNSFATGVSGAEAIGGPTLEMWINSWNAKYPNELLRFYSGGGKNSDGSVYSYTGHDNGEASTDYGYYIGGINTNEAVKGTLTNMVTWLNLTDDSTYDLAASVNYPEGTNDSLYRQSAYYLSSPGAYGVGDGTGSNWSAGNILETSGTYIGGFCYTYNYYSPRLRPVVCLPSSVKASKSGAVWMIEQ